MGKKSQATVPDGKEFTHVMVSFDEPSLRLVHDIADETRIGNVSGTLRFVLADWARQRNGGGMTTQHA